MVSNVPITEKKEKVRQMFDTWHNLHVSRLLFPFCTENLKLRRKSSNFLLLDVALVLYIVEAFKKSTIFYFVQAAKTIISTYVAQGQILLTVTTNFGPFSNPFFLAISL